MVAESIDSHEINATSSMALIGKIRSLHSVYPLTGKKKNDLLELSDDQLVYLIAVMRGEPASLPQFSEAQWNEMFEHLRAHGVLPLLYSLLKKLPQESRLPVEMMTKMNIFYRISLVDTIMLFKHAC